MKTRKPFLGLLTYSFHSISGSLILIQLFALLAGLTGIAAKIGGLDIILHSFPWMAVGAAPYILVSKSGSIEKWERYQLTMPIKRKDLATMLYLNVFLSLHLAFPVVGVVWGIGFIFQQASLYTLIHGWFPSIAYAYGTILLFTALIYPIGSTKLGGRSKDGLFFVCLVIAVAIVTPMTIAGRAMGLSNVVISVLVIAITGVAFVIGLLITRAMYAKMDF